MGATVLLLGANSGNREESLQKATQAIEERVGQIYARSGVYETAAWGNTHQQSFLNMVVVIHSFEKAAVLLHDVLKIEQELGRVRAEKWGERPMDIDVLYYGTNVISTPELKVPHPLLHERRFALVPLAEVLPNFVHPVLQKTSTELLAECKDTLPVNPYKLNVA